MTFIITNNELGSHPPLSFFVSLKEQQDKGLKKKKCDHSGCANEDLELVVQLKVISYMISQIFTVYISV